MRATAVFGLFCSLVVARPALAHITLTAPADWLVTNSSGDPQKISPCGVDASQQPGSSTYTLSNKITTVHPGDSLTVKWTETVPHDGHFRIALALTSRSELTDPMVTATNSDGTPSAVAISTAYPVLADNLFPHKATDVSAGKTYSYSVTIPNATCTKCTLQLIQFMAEHPADPSYFYHHCADLAITGTTSGTDAGTKSDAGSTHTGGRAGGGTSGSTGTSTGGHTGGASGSAGTSTGGHTGGASGSVGTSTGGTSAGATGGVSGAGTGGVSTGGSASGGITGSGTGGVTLTGGASGAGSPAAGSGGCSCQTAPGLGGGLALSLLGLFVALVRRRRA